MPRKSHAKKDQTKATKFKLESPARPEEVVGLSPAKPVRLWVPEEHCYGFLPDHPLGFGP